MTGTVSGLQQKPNSGWTLHLQFSLPTALTVPFKYQSQKRSRQKGDEEGGERGQAGSVPVSSVKAGGLPRLVL